MPTFFLILTKKNLSIDLILSYNSQKRPNFIHTKNTKFYPHESRVFCCCPRKKFMAQYRNGRGSEKQQPNRRETGASRRHGVGNYLLKPLGPSQHYLTEGFIPHLGPHYPERRQYLGQRMQTLPVRRRVIISRLTRTNSEAKSIPLMQARFRSENLYGRVIRITLLPFS